MTTDEALAEQIARALSEVDGYGPAGMHIDWVMRYYGDLAAAVLPILRDAQAYAWDEGFNSGWTERSGPGPFVNDPWNAETINPYRAAEYEKEQTHD